MAVIGVAAPFSASAQGVFNMGMLTNTLSSGTLIQSEETRAAGQSFRSRGPARTTAAINPAALSFRPDMAARKRNMAQFVAKIRRVDPASADDLQRALASHDLVAQVGASMRKAGLNPNNLADAMALYTVIAWYGVRGSDDSKPADFKPVSRQFVRSMGSTPQFARASQATKQELAESMMIQAMMAEQSVTLAKRQPGVMPQLKQAIDQGARGTFGFDLARMRLGPNGLE